MSDNKNETFCHFSLDDIEQLATEKVFERGEYLFFSGAVQKIIKDGNRFYGTVLGSREYEVELIDDKDELLIDCTCPYDQYGICKHSVAFALKILDGDFVDISPEPVPDHNGAEFSSREDFSELYSKIDTQKKLQFLKQLLDRDPDLQQQFIAFALDVPEKAEDLSLAKIDEIKEQVHSVLSNIDFDDLENYYDDYRYGYRDDWELEYHAAVEKIRHHFIPFINTVTSNLKKGNLTDAFYVLLGIYEGVQNLPDLDSESYVFDGTYIDEVNALVEEYFNSVSRLLENVIKSDNAVKEVVSLIFKRMFYHNKQLRSGQEIILYNLKDFEPVFKSLIDNKETALFLYRIIQENHLTSLATAHILLNIASVSNDEKLWFETAEAYAEFDSEIAKQLLEKYDQKGADRDFNRLAKIAFNKWADTFDKYLIEHLDKEREKDLYVEALKNYVARKKRIGYYRILRSYLTAEERKAFVDTFKNSFDATFFVRLLEIEKRYEDILSFVRKHQDHYDLDMLIKPILNIYPDECFSIIVEVNNKTLKHGRRNRNTYRQMIKTLKLLPEITTKKKEADIYLKSLYNRKPRLPALQDEMRKARLIDL